MERKWEATKKYFQDYKGFTRPFSVNLEATIRGFNIDNMAAQQAIEESKALHARRWQTKDGTYRIKKHVLPDGRDGRDVSEDAGHPPLTMSIIPKTGLATTTWVTDLLGLAAGHMVSVHYLREFDM